MVGRFSDIIGQLWCSLADYYIRTGHFEKVGNMAVELMSLIIVCAYIGVCFEGSCFSVPT